MPSTFTTNTGIEKIADGEQAGLWGQTTNLNFDIVDRALNGSGAVTLSGTTHTLTTSAGVLSDGQFAVLVFAGSLSAPNTVTIAPDTAQKLYWVRNITSQDVILSQGSGANVTIPPGAAKAVYANGAGAGAAVVDLTAVFVGNVTGNLTGNVTGNLTGDVTGNLTGDVTGNADTATALQTARNFTIGATARSFDGTAAVSWTLTDIGAQAASAQLTSVAALATNGLITRTAANTVTARTLTGTANQITVTNGNGVSGNPTVSAVIADQAEAEAGTDNTKLMTPLRVAQAVPSLTSEQATDPESAVFGTISGELLSGAIAASAPTEIIVNPTGASEVIFDDLEAGTYEFQIFRVQSASTSDSRVLQMAVSVNNGASWTTVQNGQAGVNYNANRCSGLSRINTKYGNGLHGADRDDTVGSKTAGGLVSSMGLTMPINAVRFRWDSGNFGTSSGQVILGAKLR